jgi:hypothetical protein
MLTISQLTLKDMKPTQNFYMVALLNRRLLKNRIVTLNHKKKN